MKKFIFIFLISLVYNVTLIGKYGKSKFYNNYGIVVLNANDFKSDEKIHMQFTCHNGYMNEQLRYEFSDNIPQSDSFRPSYPMNPTSTSSSQTTVNDVVVSETKTYYYDIKKTSSSYYLIMKFYDHYSDYLEVKNTKYNMANLTLIIVLSIAVIIVSVVIAIVIFRAVKRKGNRQKIDYVSQPSNNYPATYTPNQPQNEYINPAPSPSPYDNNYGQPQQSNLYYQPPTSAINY